MGLNNFFLKGGGGGGVGRGSMGRGGQFLEVGSVVLEIINLAATNFTSPLLFDILFMCKLKDNVSLVIFTYGFSLIHFIKSFLKSVLLY